MDTNFEKKLRMILLGTTASLLDLAEEEGVELHTDVQISDSGVLLVARYGDKDISWFRMNTDGRSEADPETIKFIEGIIK